MADDKPGFWARYRTLRDTPKGYLYRVSDAYQPHTGSDGKTRWYSPGDHERIRAQQQQREATAIGADLSGLYGRAKLHYETGHSVQETDEAHCRPQGVPGVPIGKGATWNLLTMQGHALTFGSTRSGKGVQSIIPALLSYGGSVVVIDPKGENAWVTAERRRQMGQRVVILDPWGEVNRRYGSKASPAIAEQIATFNPLSGLDPASDDFADDIAAIADSLVIPGGIDSHWTDSAKELIAGLVAARVEAAPGKANLSEVRAAITLGTEGLKNLVAGILKTNPNGLAARKLRRFGDATDSKEMNSVRSTAETQTAIFDSRRLAASMETGNPPFNLDELATRPTSLFLVLPVDRLQTHGRWMRLILTMAIRAIARQEEPPAWPVFFILDELGTINPGGGLRMIEQAFGLMAGLGIRIWGFLQDLSQLKTDYPQSWETFISNSSVIQALKVTDDTTSEYISRLLGNTTLERFSAESWQLRQKNTNHKAMADQVHPRPILLPQEIRDISPSKVLTHCPGFGSYLLDRQPYFAPNSPWAGLYRPLPRYAPVPPPQAAAAQKPPLATVPATEPSQPEKGWGLWQS